MQYLPNQTDTASGCGVLDLPGIGLCSTVGDIRLKRVAPVGVTSQTITVPPNTTAVAIGMQSEHLGTGGASNLPEPGVNDWAAGNYRVRFAITTGNINIQCNAIYIYSMVGAPGCGSATLLGSLTGLTQIMSSGVKTFDVTCNEQTGAAGLVLYIVVAFKNTSALMAQLSSVLPSQRIDTPILIPNRTTMGARG